MMIGEYDPMDGPDERTYRYAVLIETWEGTITAWRDDTLEDANAMADAFDSLIRERTGGEGIPMSVVDYFAHIKDES